MHSKRNDPSQHAEAEVLNEFASEDVTSVRPASESPTVFRFDQAPLPQPSLPPAGPIIDITTTGITAIDNKPLSRLDAREARRHRPRQSSFRRVQARARKWQQARAHRWLAEAAGVYHARASVWQARAGEWHSRAGEWQTDMRGRADAMRVVARRRLVATAQVALILSLIVKSIAAYLARHAAARTRHAARGAVTATRQVASQAMAARATDSALERQELSGAVLAGAVALVALAYGGYFLYPGKAAADVTSLQAVSSNAAGIDGAVAPAAVAGAFIGPRAVPVSTVDEVEPTVRRVATAPTPRTLTALWQRRDTRSLQRAFSTLRGETLAFHQCGMRVLDDDRAVARCQGVANVRADGDYARAATWTIDFRRTAGRWNIAKVTTR